MAQVYRELSPHHQEFIAQQHMFFVASAPLHEEGHVNLSPKGYDTLRILSATQVAYLDLTGSGNETSGHLSENGRITLMFCAFEGPPLILRIYGRGEAVLPGTADWDALVSRFVLRPGARQIIRVQIHHVQTSCGYGVPLMEYRHDRDTLDRWAVQKGDPGLAQYWRDKNMRTIDGVKTPLGDLIEGPETSP